MVTRKNELRLVAGCVTVLVYVLAPSLMMAQQDSPAEEPAASSNPTQRLIIPRKNQNEARQLADQQECYRRTCDQLDWDPYQAYSDLVDQGFAVALTPQEMEKGLVCLAAEGAEAGAVAGEIIGEPHRGAETGAAVSISLGLMRTGYLKDLDDPAAQKAVSRFERDLRKWDRKYAACLSRKGYQVPPR